MSSKILGGSLIIAGTAIGAGVLAVPVLTAQAGFIPTSVLYVLSWLFSMASGFCFLEVMTWLKDKKNVNMLSMTQHTLGDKGKMCMWLLYLFLFYSLLVAYFCEGGNMLFRILGYQSLDAVTMRHFAPLAFGLVFCPMVIMGTKIMDYCNRFFVLGLIATFGLFCILGFFNLRLDFLMRGSWERAFDGLPVLFLSFGFQNIVPSLYFYMDKNIRDVKKAVVIGSMIPLILYIIWEAVVLGVVPLAYLLEAQASGHTAAQAMKTALHSSAFYVVGEFFGFFALVSSFLGVALGIIDFLSDAFQWDKRTYRMPLFILTFIFPLAFAMFYPAIVLKCLSYAGGLGAALISGVFPVCMIWKGRYGKKQRFGSSERVLPGGKFVLMLMILLIIVDLISLYSR